jgi:hypothetical protein
VGQVAHKEEKKIKKTDKEGVVVQNDHARDKLKEIVIEELMRMKWQI